jgi:hypothetical protein
MDFFHGLNDRSYSEFKSQFTNDVNQQKIECPGTLIDMYGMASRYIPTVKALKPTNTAAFATRAYDHDDEYEQEGHQNDVLATRACDQDECQHERVESRRDRRPVQREDRSTNGKGDPSQPKEQNAHLDRDRDNVECYNCQGIGHYANECPSKKKIQVKWTCAMPDKGQYKWHEVLLDNQADRSIMHPRLLTNLRPADAVVTGITGDSISVTEAGDLYGFFECPASDKIGVSVLSFAEVEAKYEITYKRKRCFIVHLPGRDLVFRRKRNMYVANMSDWGGPANAKARVNVAATSKLKRNFTHPEVKIARGATEFNRNAGAASKRGAVNLPTNGNTTGADLTAQDVRKVFKMHGKPTVLHRDKMTQRDVNKTLIGPPLKNYDQVNQVMTSDVMHVGGKQYLLSLVQPLDLLLVTKLEKLTDDVIISAFKGKVDFVASRGFHVHVIHMSPQPGHGTYSGSVSGVEFDIQGAGDHSDKIDKKIGQVKELIQSVTSGLPWNLPKVLLDDVIFFAVGRLNVLSRLQNPFRGDGGVAAPRAKFTGRKLSNKKESSISFGDY